MSWSIGDETNLFLKLKSKLAYYHVVFPTTKTPPEKLTLTVVEMPKVPEIEKIDSKEELSCLDLTIYNGRRRVCVNFEPQTDKLSIVTETNSLYVKDNKTDLKVTECQSLLAKRVYLLSYDDGFYKRCIVLDETATHRWNKLYQEWIFSFWWAFYLSSCIRG